MLGSWLSLASVLFESLTQKTSLKNTLSQSGELDYNVVLGVYILECYIVIMARATIKEMYTIYAVLCKNNNLGTVFKKLTNWSFC